MNYLKSSLAQMSCLAIALGALVSDLSLPATAQQVSPCRNLGNSDTVVIIEASNPQRMQLVNQVVSQHSLQGSFCASQRTGKTVWMSNQMTNVNTAVKVFDYFRSVGLVSPVNPGRNNNNLIRTSNPYHPVSGNSVRL
jgi:hypothetical protein